MKAVFPCKGVVVVTKQNVDVLSNFYESQLINSKLFSAYSQNNFAVQVGKLNYLPKNSTIILNQDANLLTIQKLNQVLVETSKNENPKDYQGAVSNANDDEPIEDNFILNHPFFETLNPLD